MKLRPLHLGQFSSLRSVAKCMGRTNTSHALFVRARQRPNSIDRIFVYVCALEISGRQGTHSKAYGVDISELQVVSTPTEPILHKVKSKVSEARVRIPLTALFFSFRDFFCFFARWCRDPYFMAPELFLFAFTCCEGASAPELHRQNLRVCLCT